MSCPEAADVFPVRLRYARRSARARAGGALVKLVYFGRVWYSGSIPIMVLPA